MWQIIKQAARDIYFHWWYGSWCYRWQQRQWTRQWEKIAGMSMADYLAKDYFIDKYHFVKQEGELSLVVDRTKVESTIEKINQELAIEQHRRVVMQTFGIPPSIQKGSEVNGSENDHNGVT